MRIETCDVRVSLFNGHGHCLAAKRRPGDVRSAEAWDELLLEAERQQADGKEVAFRAEGGSVGLIREAIWEVMSTLDHEDRTA